VFELAKQLPQYGVGSRFTRARWEHRGAPDSYWTVMRMKPKASGRAGRAWGQLTWKGEAKEGVRRIPGTMKAGIWRVLEESKTISGPKLSKPEPSAGDEASLG
jgi:small subunit ribosomal protein S34